jgi:hypothetical protein
MVLQHVLEAHLMTDQKSKRLPLIIPPGLWQRIEQEKLRRKQGTGSLRPEATSILLEAVDAFLAEAEKKAKLSTTSTDRE